jgi:hypothetical protein
MRKSIYWFGGALVACVSGCSASAPQENDLVDVQQAVTAYTLSGRVLTADNLGIAGVSVTLKGKASKQTTTDANGNYSFSGLASGSYTVTPGKTSCTFSPSSKSVSLSGNTTVTFSGSGTGCVVNAKFNKKAYVLIFNPNITVNGTTKTLTQYEGWDDPDTLINNYISWMKTASAGRVNYTIATRKLVNDWPVKLDGFKYNQTTYINGCNPNSGAGCHSPDDSDYLKFLNDNKICEAVNAGTVDELFIMGGPFFGFNESRLTGPKAYFYNGYALEGSTCQKLLPMMGFNYQAGFPNMVHDFIHRTESTMSRVYGSWEENSLVNNWDKFALNAAQSPSIGFSGCGGAHWTPTSTLAGGEYIYDTQGPVNSYCDDFLNYPNLHTPSTVLKPIGCSAWGCSDIGFYQWWLQHMPKAPGFGSDDKLADWWRYAIDPSEVFLTDRATCSSELDAGWCQAVSDGSHGTCNVGEWSTATVPTGSVQVNFRLPKTATSVTVYDRACDEQVLSGRVQLSDGTTMSFGALENTGTTGTKLTFSSKQISWVKVYIDSSSGPNPGISEIVVK